MKNSNFLVTGGAGFIGYHVSKKLLELGGNVIIIDNLNDYYQVQLKIDRLKELGIDFSFTNKEESIRSSIYDNLTFYHLDLLEKEKVEKLFSVSNFDFVLNFAAQAGVRYSFKNPSSYIQSNIVGFHNLIDLASAYKIKHFYYASSSSVYGVDSVAPFSTDQHADRPISLYAATKRSNELIAHVYSYSYQLPTTGLRFFTVYGPFGRPDMAYFEFSKRIMDDVPIQVFNNGDMIRDFTYIDDVVEAMERIIEKNMDMSGPSQQDSKLNYNVFNIGNSSPVKLMHFIKVIEQNLQKRAIIEYCDTPSGDVLKTYADSSELENWIDYKPTTTIEVGLAKFTQWFLKYYSGK